MTMTTKRENRSKIMFKPKSKKRNITKVYEVNIEEKRTSKNTKTNGIKPTGRRGTRRPLETPCAFIIT